MNMDHTDVPTEQTPLLVSSDTIYAISLKSREAEKKFSLDCVTLRILFTELCERLTFASISANMVLFLTNYLLFRSPDAVTISLIFTGTCSFVPLLGGWIADSISGKFNCIYGSTLIYFVGALLLTSTAFNYADIIGPEYEMDLTTRRIYFLIGVFVVAIGTGGIKANVGPFGAQQNEHLGPIAVQSFFNWFYWFIQIGAVISSSVVAYIQQEIGFDVGFLIPVAAIFLALIIFVSGRDQYLHSPPAGSIFTQVTKIIIQGAKRKWNSRPSVKLDSYLDFAKTTYGGSFSEEEVNDIKQFGRTIPVYLCLIMYWTAYQEMGSLLLVVGPRLNIDIAGFHLPVIAMSLFNIIPVLVFIPVMDKLVYPCLKRLNLYPSLMQRIGFGMLLTAAAVVTYGITEVLRKRNIGETGGVVQIVGGKMYTAATFSILWLTPSFFLVGVGEVFTVISSYQFAYTDSPKYMKGLVMGINMATSGIGGYAGSLLVNICNAATASDPWIPDEINNGYLENFYFLVAGLLVLNFFVFVFVAKRYKPIPAEDKEPEEIIVNVYNCQRKADQPPKQLDTHTNDNE